MNIKFDIDPKELTYQETGWEQPYCGLKYNGFYIHTWDKVPSEKTIEETRQIIVTSWVVLLRTITFDYKLGEI